MMNDYDTHWHDGETSEPESQLALSDYIRFVALGDSASCGVGDPTPGGWRGWARILAEAIAMDHHVSFCTLAVPGATVADIEREKLTEALDHRPVIASLIVGLNDAMRSTWDPEQIRQDLLHCAGELARQGALVVTVHFHDHTRVLGLPALLAGPVRRRIQILNEIYDEVHDRYGALRLDLSADRAIYSRELWAADRLHPSELGHRRLARQVGQLIADEGLEFELPSLTCTSERPRLRETARTLVIDVAPLDRPPRPRSCPLGRPSGSLAGHQGKACVMANSVTSSTDDNSASPRPRRRGVELNATAAIPHGPAPGAKAGLVVHLTLTPMRCRSRVSAEVRRTCPAPRFSLTPREPHVSVVLDDRLVRPDIQRDRPGWPSWPGSPAALRVRSGTP